MNDFLEYWAKSLGKEAWFTSQAIQLKERFESIMKFESFFDEWIPSEEDRSPNAQLKSLVQRLDYSSQCLLLFLE